MQPITFEPERRTFRRRFIGIFILVALWFLGSYLLTRSRSWSEAEQFLLVAPIYGVVCASPFLWALFPILPKSAPESHPVVQYAVQIANQVGASLKRVEFVGPEVSISNGTLRIPHAFLDEADRAKVEAGIALALVKNRRDWGGRLSSIAIFYTGFVVSAIQLAAQLSNIQYGVLFAVSVCIPLFFIPRLISARLHPRLVREASELTGDPEAIGRFTAAPQAP